MMETERDEIDRKETGFRILYSLLFWVIAGVVEMVVGALVVFELLFALVTKREPPGRVRVLANRVIAYFYRVGRYLTYNEPDPPFPFSEFPTEIEPTGSGS
jgi:hypothetical protein